MKDSTSRRKFSKLLFSLPFIPVFGISGCDGKGLSDSGSANHGSMAKEGTVSGSGKWASGGTDLISVDYPDDGLFQSTNPCRLSLTRETTLGPCYFEDDTGEDISLGYEGLPMQLCLRLIDNECRPLDNYEIEVWHCDTQGVYSGDTSNSVDAGGFAGDFCTGGDDAAQKSSWYRGKLTTDSSGRVNFKTCFPGWYRGRTIHIHFAIRDHSGAFGLISQFCFTDELAKEICTTHNFYRSRGEQDTPLAGGRDSVFPAAGYEDFLLKTKQNVDGSLLAYQTIQIA
ncbi:MAG: intradiol ring-cleavage dioxygenase [Neptuniibacter sp.]